MRTFNFRNLVQLDIWNSPTLMTWMSYAARSITMLGILPLILHKFSSGDIVVWYLLSTMISLQMLADYGLRQTFARIISYAFGGAEDITIIQYDASAKPNFRNPCNKQLLASIISSMKFLYKWLTIVVFLLLITLGSWAMKKPIENTDFQQDAWLAWSIFVVTSILSFYSKIYQNFLEGLNKIALVRKIETFTSLGGIVCSIIVLIWAPSLLNLVIVTQFWIVAASIRDWLLCQRIEKSLWKIVNSNLPPDKVILRKIWGPVWKSAVSGMMSGGILSFSSMIYAQFGDKGVVASFLLAIRLISQIRDVSMAPFYSKIPVMSRLRVQHNMVDLIHIVKNGMRWSHVVFVFGFVMTTICIKPFLSIIGSEVAFVDKPLWILLGLSFFAHRYGAMHLQVYLSTNHIIAHIADGISGLLFILISLLLINTWGIYSIPVGMLAGYLCFYCWYCALYSYRSMDNQRFWQFEQNVSIPSIVIILLFSTFYLI